MLAVSFFSREWLLMTRIDPDRLKAARNQQKLSQVALARISGVGRGTIAQIETGGILETDHGEALASALGLRLSDLAMGSGGSPAPSLPFDEPPQIIKRESVGSMRDQADASAGEMRVYSYVPTVGMQIRLIPSGQGVGKRPAFRSNEGEMIALDVADALMEPAYLDGDRLYLIKGRQPKVYDDALFVMAGDAGEAYLGRVTSKSPDGWTIRSFGRDTASEVAEWFVPRANVQEMAMLVGMSRNGF